MFQLFLHFFSILWMLCCNISEHTMNANKKNCEEKLFNWQFQHLYLCLMCHRFGYRHFLARIQSNVTDVWDMLYASLRGKICMFTLSVDDNGFNKNRSSPCQWQNECVVRFVQFFFAFRFFFFFEKYANTQKTVKKNVVNIDFLLFNIILLLCACVCVCQCELKNGAKCRIIIKFVTANGEKKSQEWKILPVFSV